MFGALACTQPFAADAQQFGNFIKAGQGHAALEPVIDVLRGNLTLGGKIRRRQAALEQKGFETITGCIHEARV
ncbi:hypothetical protein D3C77_575870 [compost metagenome]